MLPRTHLISFSTPSHRKVQKELHDLYGKRFGMQTAYTEEDIKNSPIYKEPIFKYPKYFGYFLWKPYLILKTLKETPCDVVLYLDSNMRQTSPDGFNKFEALVRDGINREGIFIPKYNFFFNREWTKEDTYVVMNCTGERYRSAPQVWTVAIAFDKRPHNFPFIEEWLYYTKNIEASTDEPNKYGQNDPAFKAHRWEQSIFSILVEKYGIQGSSFLETISVMDKIYPQEILDEKKRIGY